MKYLILLCTVWVGVMIPSTDARFGVNNPPLHPSFFEGPLCWSSEPQVLQGCPIGVNIDWSVAPAVNLVSGTVGNVASVSIDVSPEYLKSQQVATIGQVPVNPKNIWMCPLNLGVCSPKQRREVYSFTPKSGNTTFNRDGDSLGLDFEFETPITPGDYSILAEFVIHSVHYLIAANRTILQPVAIEVDATAQTPLYEEASCQLSNVETGEHMGSVSVNLTEASLDVSLLLEQALSSDSQLRLFETGDRDELFGQKEPFRPQLLSKSNCKDEGMEEFCNNGILLTLPSGERKPSIPVQFDEKYLALNGANSVLGRAIELVDAATSDSLAWCVVGNPVIRTPRTLGVPLPAAPSLTCTVAGQSLNGHISIERFDKDFDADLVSNSRQSTNPVRARVNYLLESTAQGDWGQASIGLLVHTHSMASSTDPQAIQGSTWQIRENGIATGVNVVDDFALNASVDAGDVLDLLVKRSDGVSEVSGSCTLARAAYGLEEPKPRLAITSGSVPQATAASCIMVPGMSSASGGAIERVSGFVRVKDNPNNGVDVAFGFVGFEPPTSETEYVLHFHENGDVSNAMEGSLGDNFHGAENVNNGDYGIAITLNPGMRQAFGSHYFKGFHLMGPFGLLGKGASLAVKGAPNNRLAECVLGRAHGSETIQPAKDFPNVEAASCRLQSIANPMGPVAGQLFLRRALDINGRSNTLITYAISGLSPGPQNRWRVHDFGEAGGSPEVLGNVFNGTQVLRYNPPCVRELEGNHDCNFAAMQLGNILGNGILTGHWDGLASGRVTDEAIALRGRNSVIGRSIVVYSRQDGGDVARAACTVGLASSPLPNPGLASLETRRPVTRAPTVSKADDRTEPTGGLWALGLVLGGVGILTAAQFRRKTLRQSRRIQELQEFAGFDGLDTLGGEDVEGRRVPPPPPRDSMQRMTVT